MRRRIIMVTAAATRATTRTRRGIMVTVLHAPALGSDSAGLDMVDSTAASGVADDFPVVWQAESDASHRN